MEDRDVTIEAAGKTHRLRFTMAAYRILDPDGKVEVKEILDYFARRENLVLSVLGCLEGWRLREAPDSQAHTKEGAEFVIDEAGYGPVRAAVATAILRWLNPKAEGPGSPKAVPGSSVEPGASAQPTP